MDTVYRKVRTTTEMLEEMLHDMTTDGNNQYPNNTVSPQNRPQRRGDAYMRSNATYSTSQDTLKPDDFRPNWNGPSRFAFESRDADVPARRMSASDGAERY